MQSFHHDGQELRYKTIGDAAADTVFIWAHGWGHSHAAFTGLAGSLEGLGHHVLLDLPGFGESPQPLDSWSPEDYAHFLAHFVATFSNKRIIWVGHSFGCRVGLHLAAHTPDIIHILILISAAGLRRKRPLLKSIYYKSKILTYKCLKRLIPFGLSEDWLKSHFGSRDYKSAGAMRDILLATLREDLSETATQVKCRTVLIYGSADDETPPEMGERYKRYISNSVFVQLEGFDHYSILNQGLHQVAQIIKNEVLKDSS